MTQIDDYLSANNLYPFLQSAYHKHHSTETSLLKLTNYIGLALDNSLDLAFDTVDHQNLLSRLHIKFGISGSALSWLTSYLSARHQTVCINRIRSSSMVLDCCVPQGSVLGPLLFTHYASSIEDIIR